MFLVLNCSVLKVFNILRFFKFETPTICKTRYNCSLKQSSYFVCNDFNVSIFS